MLAIEIDGIYHSHIEKQIEDKIRQSKLESLGVRFIRFSESEVKYDMLNVIRSLEEKVIHLIKADPTITLPVNFNHNLLA